MLLPYIPPRCYDVPNVKIPKKSRDSLVASSVPKIIKLLKDILPNLQNLSSANHDTKKKKFRKEELHGRGAGYTRWDETIGSNGMGQRS